MIKIANEQLEGSLLSTAQMPLNLFIKFCPKSVPFIHKWIALEEKMNVIFYFSFKQRTKGFRWIFKPWYTALEPEAPNQPNLSSKFRHKVWKKGR